MAKAGLLFAGTDDGVVLFSNPGAVGRWLRVGQELRGHAIRAIWPAADNPLIVLAAGASMGLQRSDDAGAQWGRYGMDASAGIAALADVPGQPGVLYAVAGEALYRCRDAEERWERIEGARPDASAALAVLAGKEPVLLMALAGGAGLG